MKQYSCGAVTFMKDDKTALFMGQERTALLRAAYRREPLPAGVMLAVVENGSFVPRPLAWEEVYWLTCGAAVHDGKVTT